MRTPCGTICCLVNRYKDDSSKFLDAVEISEEELLNMFLWNKRKFPNVDNKNITSKSELTFNEFQYARKYEILQCQ